LLQLAEHVIVSCHIPRVGRDGRLVLAINVKSNLWHSLPLLHFLSLTMRGDFGSIAT
jgi:hypothetical protein